MVKPDFVELFRVFSNALSQLTIRLAGGITTFIVTLLILGSLGFTNLGSFVKVTAFVAIFYLLVDFGINTVYLRDYFKEVEKFFGNVLTLRLLIALCVFAVILIITFFLPSGESVGFSFSEKLGIAIFSCTIFTEAILISFSGLVQKKLLQRKLLFPTVVSSLFVLAVVYFGVSMHNLYLIFLAYPLGDIVQIFLIFLFVKRAVEFSLLPIDFRSFSRKTIRASGPIALMLLLNVVYFRVDTFILSIDKSTTDVGIYGFAYKVFEFLIAFPTFLSASVFPILILNKDNKTEFGQKVRSYAVILLISSCVISFTVFLLSPLLGFFRQDLTPAVMPIQILSLALPFFFLTSFFQWVLLIRNRVKILITIYASTMIVNLTLNIIYVPLFSYKAASIITVITEGLVFLLMILAFTLNSSAKSSKPNDN